MKNSIETKAKSYINTHRKASGWRRFLTIVACVVVFCTTYALIFPAAAWERSLICEKEEHKHTDECWNEVFVPAEKELVCGLEEHVHSDECYQERQELVCGYEEGELIYPEPETILVCELEERSAHVHDSSCYNEAGETVCGYHVHDAACFNEAGELICGLQEDMGHTHTDECRLIVQTEPVAHEHTDECYQTVRELVCTATEHTHAEDCYKEHEHTDECYGEDGALVCTKGEHTDKVLVCGKEEHEHIDSCYDAPPTEDDGYFCGMLEHIHTEECFFEDGSLKCTLEEHQHTPDCRSNIQADVESEEQWTAAFAGLQLSGNWPEDILAIADTQLGYCESEANFKYDEESAANKGYTRYGAWYGDTYGDWCAMFCSFCIRYAGIDQYPIESGVRRWIDTLESPQFSLYHPVTSNYQPKPGDLVFFDFEAFENQEDRNADHVGLVYSVEADENGNLVTITTIEGNNGSSVRTFEYSADDTRFLGWGEMPANEEGLNNNFELTTEVKYTVNTEDEEGVIISTEERTVTVKVSGPNDSLPYPVEDITLTASLIEDEETIQKLFETFHAQGLDLSCRLLLDISIWHEGLQIEPVGPVYVSISGYDEEGAWSENSEFFVFHVDAENGEVANMEATENDEGELVMETNHFSIFAVASQTVSGTYYQRVSSISASDSTKYIIVSANGSYALTYGASGNAKAVNLVPVKGNEGYFTVEGVTNNMRWTFRSKNYVRNVANTNQRLVLSDSSVFGTSDISITRTYNSTKSTWTLKNGSNYYLYISGNSFSANNSTTDKNTYYRDVYILKEVNTTLTIPADPGYSEGGEGGGSSGGGDVFPGTPSYIDPSGPKTGSDDWDQATGVSMAYFSDPATSDIERDFLLNGGTKTSLSLTAESGTAVMTNEGYGNLFDNDTGTKYCVNPDNGQVTVIFKAEESHNVSSYSLTTANDNAGSTGGRLPSGWKLYGSNSTGKWFLMDEVTSTGMSAVNYQEYSYKVDFPGKYKRFKMVFEASSMIQFSELKLYYDEGADLDGKILTDKSVIYNDDDYGVLGDFASDEFGVTLSALAQQYELFDSTQEKIPVDVVLVLDVSGSMGNTVNGEQRAQTVVTATNTLIDRIMSYHPQNRVGIVTFSSGSADFLQIGRYYVGSSTNNPTYNGTYQYLTYSSNTISTNSNLRNASTNSKVTQVSRSIAGGTYTQHGIARGAAMYNRVTDTTYTTSEGEVVIRTPLMLLLSDGDPTHCTSNYTDVLSGPHYGSGSYPSEENNKGVQGYYTILSANYYKWQIGVHYNKPAKVYTIGMGIYSTGIADASDKSATGDHYKRAVLNPTAANISALYNTAAKNYSTTSHQLRSLLRNEYTDHYIQIGSSSSYDALGTTNRNIPVLSNPYISTGYAYADGAYFKEDYDPSALIAIFDQIVIQNMETRQYVHSYTEKTDITVTDSIGEGMRVTSDPVLRYNGVNYTHSGKTVDGTTTVYTYTGSVSPNKYSTAQSLAGITVTISEENGRQKVEWKIIGELLPEFSKAKTADWYYWRYPARLIYKVGLTDASKTEVAALTYGQSKTYYTNVPFSGGFCDILPSENNPYYNDFGFEVVQKTENTTNTALNSFEHLQFSGSTTRWIRQGLGNNGKLVFTKDNVTTLHVEKVWADSPEKDHSTDSVTVQLKQNGKAYGDPVTLNSENSWMHDYVLLPIADDNNVEYVYTIEETEVPGYLPTYTSGTYKLEKEGGGYKLIPSITVTNTEKRTINVTVIKEFDGATPVPVDIQLYKVSSDMSATAVGNAVTLALDSADNKYKHTFNDLEELQTGEFYAITEVTTGYNVVYGNQVSINVNGQSVFAGKVSETEPGVIRLTNMQYYELPETGGTGKTPIYSIGALLITASALIYGYTLRRKRERRSM